jgi:ectoine hydroxylase-related dioxygenase (phytanoyl-CoA dioxygenase family)
MSQLSAQTVRDFQDDGVAFLRGVFAPEWIAQLRAGLDRNIADPGPHHRVYTGADDGGHFFGDYCNWQRIAEYETVVRQSPAAALARQLMASRKAMFFHEHVLVKEPGTAKPTPWHHDQPYYCVDGWQNVSLWIPLDPVARESAVEFIAGSHKWDAWYTPKKFVGEDYQETDKDFQAMPDITADRQAYDLRGADLQSGDCVAFHFRTVHGAPGNQSRQQRRRAIALRWLGDDSRYVTRPGMMSPPFHEFPENTLRDGDEMASELFPVIA